MNSVMSLIPTKYLVPAGILASANKRLIIPSAKRLASSISTGMGILTEQEAKQQEKLFDEMLFPITSIIDNLEQQVINILGGNLSETLLSWVGGKKKHAPTEIMEKEDQAVGVVNEYVSAIGQNVGPQKNEATSTEFKKILPGTRRPMSGISPKTSFTQKSQVSATNIDMSLFNALEHENAHNRETNPNPSPALSGTLAQSFAAPTLSSIAKSMRTPGEGTILVPKKKRGGKY